MPRLYHTAVQLPLFVPYKVCISCVPPTEKRIDEFSKDRSRSDGHCVYCKVCSYAKIRAIQKKGHPSYTKKLAYNREYKLRYEARYREYNKAYGSAYAQKHPQKMHEYAMRRYAHKQATTVQKVNYEHILERDGMWCYICERDILPHHKLNFDHVIPLIPCPGEPVGTHTEDNIKPVHSVCNFRKHNFRLEDLTPYHRRGVN